MSDPNKNTILSEKSRLLSNETHDVEVTVDNLDESDQENEIIYSKKGDMIADVVENSENQPITSQHLQNPENDTNLKEENRDADDQNKADEDYINPIEDPYEKAWKYLSKHNILQLFQSLTADVVYRLPDEPLDYMVDEIEKLQEQDRQRKGVIKRKAASPAFDKEQKQSVETENMPADGDT